jgi:hypothetical protein
MVRAYRLVSVGLLSVALLLAGCSGDDGANGAPGAPGAPGEQGPPGTSVGTVSGTVTNSLTGTGIQGVTITSNPAVAGVSMTTDAQGKYSGQLPIGVYALTFSGANLKPDTESVSIVAGQTATKNVAMVPVAPVVISTKVQGTAEPGNTVTVSATVTAMDGSTPGGVTWTQKSGAPVALTPQGDSVQVELPDLTAFKDEFFTIVDEERHALLDRNMIMGITPLDLEEAGTVTLTATTQSGVSQDVAIAVTLPFAWSTGLQNEPIGLPVLLHGKSATGYNWTLSAPGGSTASLQDASTQNPYFTPDVKGKYTVTESGSGASIVVYSSNWMGEIGPNGQPSSTCKACHSGPASTCPPSIPTCDKFTQWAQSGHAQIFTKNLNSGGHYSPSCFPCHTVGYDLTENPVNNGFDDQRNYAAFLNEFFPGGHSPTANPNNWTNMLAKYPDVAQLANIQCENCHGPLDVGTHFADTTTIDAHVSISSDVCGRCHGEPPRHGRFQEWQRSAHADFTLPIEEATVENRGATAAHCGRCHSGQGFLQWITQADLTKNIQGANGNATVAELTALGLTEDTVQPQTCATCHDPHAQGNGGANATVRIEGSTKMLPAGFAAEGVGKGALCITCHNTRNGAHNSDVGDPTSYSAPHTPSQGDLLMGQNAYFVTVGQRSRHSFIADTCVTCHLVLSPPPPDISMAGQTNHQFNASLTICGDCHGDFDGGTLQTSVQAQLDDLATAMSAYLMNKINTAGTTTIIDQTPHQSGGESYDLASDPMGVPGANIASVSPIEVHGQQAFAVTFNNPVTFTYKPSGEAPHTLTLATASVQLGNFLGSDGTTKLIPLSDPLVKAGWNYDLVNGDGSKGVHNPSFIINVLAAAQDALQ